MEGIINPLNYYALSKITVDYWVQDHLNEFKSIQGFRYFNVYGEGEENKGDQASPIHKFTEQIKEQVNLNCLKVQRCFLEILLCGGCCHNCLK